jgi:hypothetical protein
MLLAGALTTMAFSAAQAHEPLPDAEFLEFLEYLGSWDESDEEWLLVREDALRNTAKDDERNDAAPEGEESTESNDEQ